MVVMTPREKWTDERLDDLNEKVDRGFERTERAIADTKADLRAEIAETKADLRAEIADTKAEMRAGFARVDAEIRGLRSDMNAGFEAANRNLIAVTVAIIAAIVGSNVFF